MTASIRRFYLQPQSDGQATFPGNHHREANACGSISHNIGATDHRSCGKSHRMTSLPWTRLAADQLARLLIPVTVGKLTGESFFLQVWFLVFLSQTSSLWHHFTLLPLDSSTICTEIYSIVDSLQSNSWKSLSDGKRHLTNKLTSCMTIRCLLLFA